MPKISVIIPAYNAEKCIGNIIGNVINQSFQDWELIVVDDGSTDKTSAICDNYAVKDTRIKIIHKINGGVSAARNTGIDNASGIYVMFIDADDYIIPQYIDALYSSLCGADMGVFPMKAVISEKDIPTNIKYLNFNFQKYLLQEAFPILAKKRLVHPPVGKIFSKEIISKYNIRFENDVAMGEDYLFNMTYLEHCETISIGKEQIYCYIKGNSVLSKTIRTDYADLQMRFYTVMEKFCKKHGINFPLNDKRYDILFESYASIYKAPNLSKKEKISAIYRICQSDITSTYLNEDHTRSFKELMFKLLLKNPTLNKIIIR